MPQDFFSGVNESRLFPTLSSILERRRQRELTSKLLSGDITDLQNAGQYLGEGGDVGTLTNLLALEKLGQTQYTPVNQESGGAGYFAQKRNQPPTYTELQAGTPKAQPASLLRTTTVKENGVTKNVDLYGYVDPKTQKEVITDKKYQDFTPNGTGNPASQLDKSYQFHTSQVSALAKPLQDRQDRIDRLKQSLDQHTPQADALVAPELLTAMAGGQGSGLRMNEAEISRIVGGRTAFESLKSTLKKYINKPDQPFLITDEQRKQIYNLLDVVNNNVQSKQNAIIQAQQGLSEATTTAEHKKIFSNLRNQLRGNTAVVQPKKPVHTKESLDKLSNEELDKILNEMQKK